MRLAYSLGCDLLDEGKTHVCYCSASVKSALFFHLEHDVLDGLFLILSKAEAADDDRVTFDDLSCSKSQRNIRTQRVVLDKMRCRMYASVHRSAVIVLIAEVGSHRFFLVFCDMYRVIDELVDSLVLGSRDRNYRCAEDALHLIDIDRASVGVELVHHVQRNYDRNVHLEKLHRKIHISLDVGGINDVDDRFRLILQNEVPRYDLFAAVRGH